MISRTSGVCWAVAAAVAAGCGGGRDTAATAASPGSVASGVPTASAAAPSGATAPAAAPTAAAGAEPTGALASLAWLVGTWGGSGADGSTIEETWAVDGAALRGDARTVTKDGTERREAMRVEARGEAVVLVARPDGAAAPTEFPLDPRTSGAAHAQFVNEDHDWPTRIRYERVGDELRIRVRGRPGQPDESATLTRR